jgi:hypothetical protein
VAAGTGAEVGVAFSGADPGDGALDADLPFERVPEEDQRGLRVGEQVVAFAAFVVGEEDEAAFIKRAEQDDAAVGHAVGRGGAERHGVGLVELGGDGRIHPFAEQVDGIGAEVRLFEGAGFVALADGLNQVRGLHRVLPP